MGMLDDILSRGYFPKELPPCFTTVSFAQTIMNVSNKPKMFDEGKTTARACIHNLARAGSLRRKLNIVNPIPFFPLAKCIADNWSQLESKCKGSYLSKSLPVIDSSSQRAIVSCNVESDLTESRSQIRAPQYVIIKTDIANFYPSIYTHSIPWALHGKSVAKRQKKNTALLGNKIDTFLRNCQDGQTMGIPIGPDISLVIAELILATVDESIFSKLNNPDGVRYYDDYEFAVKSAMRANEILGLLQEFLGEFELTLNPNKTILSNLPHELEHSWVHQIRTFEFRNGAGQKADIIKFFDLLFNLIRTYPAHHVAKYALTRFYLENLGDRLVNDNWPLLESLILQTCMAEPGGLPSAYRIILEQGKKGRPIDKNLISTMLTNKIAHDAPLGYSSEVAWSLWGAIALDIKLNDIDVKSITSMNDSIVALLSLDAHDRKLLCLTQGDIALWQQYMLEDELYGSQWLLAYEACHKGWILDTKTLPYLSRDPAFSFLHANEVSFYEPISSDPLASLVNVIKTTSRTDLYPVSLSTTVAETEEERDEESEDSEYDSLK